MNAAPVVAFPIGNGQELLTFWVFVRHVVPAMLGRLASIDFDHDIVDALHTRAQDLQTSSMDNVRDHLLATISLVDKLQNNAATARGTAEHVLACLASLLAPFEMMQTGIYIVDKTLVDTILEDDMHLTEYGEMKAYAYLALIYAKSVLGQTPIDRLIGDSLDLAAEQHIKEFIEAHK